MRTRRWRFGAFAIAVGLASGYTTATDTSLLSVAAETQYQPEDIDIHPGSPSPTVPDPRGGVESRLTPDEIVQIGLCVVVVGVDPCTCADAVGVRLPFCDAEPNPRPR